MLHWTVPFRQLIAHVIDMEILFAITRNYYKLISSKIGVNNIYRVNTLWDDVKSVTKQDYRDLSYLSFISSRVRFINETYN